MLSLVMTEVERIANDPLPVAQRPPRIAALERELDELHRVEEALVVAAIAAGEQVYRSPSAPPAAVLGVRVADKVSRGRLISGARPGDHVVRVALFKTAKH